MLDGLVGQCHFVSEAQLTLLLHLSAQLGWVSGRRSGGLRSSSRLLGLCRRLRSWTSVRWRLLHVVIANKVYNVNHVVRIVISVQLGSRRLSLIVDCIWLHSDDGIIGLADGALLIYGYLFDYCFWLDLVVSCRVDRGCDGFLLSHQVRQLLAVHLILRHHTHLLLLPLGFFLHHVFDDQLFKV